MDIFFCSRFRRVSLNLYHFPTLNSPVLMRSPYESRVPTRYLASNLIVRLLTCFLSTFFFEYHSEVIR